MTIRRGFADVAGVQAHYRTAGAGAPIILFHASPGSAKQLEPLIAALASSARVIAPDTPGNGDTPPLGILEPTAADLAAAQLHFLDAMDLETVDVYGTHTGGCIAAELAILAPGRVRRLVLDGIGMWEGEEQADLLARYALPFTPDLDGAYLQRAFTFCRDQFLFFPWYMRDRAHRIDGGLGSADMLHDWVIELLKASTTYAPNYRAAFRWPARERLAYVRTPTLVLAAETDPVRELTERVAAWLPGARYLALPRGDQPGFPALLAQAVLDHVRQQ